MNQKTIRLDEIYRVKNGVVYGSKYSHDDEYRRPVYVDYETKYKIGTEVMLVSITNVSPNAIRGGYNMPKYQVEFTTDGIGGNSNSNIKRYHGWRGTSDDKSVYAHGLRKITAIRKLKNGTVAVTVGKDLLPEEK